ncbi:hypothetical protein EGR_03794 [Echinococcus granulosus]|uniref:Uncharacterized protein n=1 Tax=Echinococcus granulosus TaxID=6210 RepID=W6UJS9_ECHGR|nr:hypothetical protein EGR_03794 [Echinococcus granulosus]EUB61308.1 hypothetical protein EGR_03794 [Echinococcus granulosus]
MSEERITIKIYQRNHPHRHLSSAHPYLSGFCPAGGKVEEALCVHFIDIFIQPP